MFKVTRPACQFCAAIAVCLVLADSAAADFKRTYSSGLRDYDSEQYADAIEGLRKAIQEEPTAKESVRFYGMSFAPYLPYFFLGQSLFKSGDCEGALVEWRKSIEQGVVQEHEEFDELQKNQATCQKQLDMPPTVLLQAVEAYFQGDFQAAAGVDISALKEDRAKVQALLFRAASNYNLWLLSEETDSQLYKRVQDDIRSIKRLKPSFSPYAEGFSPEFLKLFSQTG